MRPSAGKCFLVTAVVLGVGYALTWTFGLASARESLANQGEQWFTPQMPSARQIEDSDVRRDMLEGFEKLDIATESRGRLDFAFTRQFALLPGLVVARVVPCGDGHCVPEATFTSFVVWYGLGSRSL